MLKIDRATAHPFRPSTLTASHGFALIRVSSSNSAVRASGSSVSFAASLTALSASGCAAAFRDASCAPRSAIRALGARTSPSGGGGGGGGGVVVASVGTVAVQGLLGRWWCGSITPHITDAG